MAFKKGVENTEGARIVRYIGVAGCKVLAVNPDEKKAAELLGYESTIAPYVGEAEVNGKKVQNVRLDFIVVTDEEKYGVAVPQKLTFFIQNSYRVGSNSGKYQVVDKYGRFAWATTDEIKAKAIPQYANGPANISEGYRPAYVGEEELTDFLIKLLNIPNVQKWNAKEKKFEGLVDNPEDSEARLDGIADYFKGNFKELQTILSYQPNNKIKLLWGVRTNTDTNRTYQAIYNRMFLNNRATDYSKLTAEIAERKNSGALTDTEYFVNGKVVDFQEYVPEATDFSAPKPASDPFSDASVPSGLPWS